MKAYLSTALILGASLCAPFAMADEAVSSSANPLYGSIGLQAYVNKKSDTHFNAVTANLGAKITPNFAVEGELSTGLNTDNNTIGAYKLTRRVAAYAVGSVPVSDKISLFARAGLADTRYKKPSTALNAEGGTSRDLGLGALYKFNDDMGMRLDLTHSDYLGKHGNSDSVGISLLRKF